MAYYFLYLTALKLYPEVKIIGENGWKKNKLPENEQKKCTVEQ